MLRLNEVALNNSSVLVNILSKIHIEMTPRNDMEGGAMTSSVDGYQQILLKTVLLSDMCSENMFPH